MADSLDKLTILGFKSIRELKDFELKALNIFVGANGSGKSNLISFFRMLLSLIKGNLADYVRDNGGIVIFSTMDGRRQNKWSLKPALAVGNKLPQFNQARAKTTSHNLDLRFLLVAIAFILSNLRVYLIGRHSLSVNLGIMIEKCHGMTYYHTGGG
jgi:predicted ATPase